MSNRRLIVIFLLALLALYVLFQARFLIIGPHLSILMPKDGQTLDTEVITISGSAENVSELWLNGRQIYTDETGAWSERIALPKGYSIISVTAKDRLGRQTEKLLHVVVN